MCRGEREEENGRDRKKGKLPIQAGMGRFIYSKSSHDVGDWGRMPRKETGILTPLPDMKEKGHVEGELNEWLDWSWKGA